MSNETSQGSWKKKNSEDEFKQKSSSTAAPPSTQMLKSYAPPFGTSMSLQSPSPCPYESSFLDLSPRKLSEQNATSLKHLEVVWQRCKENGCNINRSQREGGVSYSTIRSLVLAGRFPTKSEKLPLTMTNQFTHFVNFSLEHCGCSDTKNGLSSHSLPICQACRDEKKSCSRLSNLRIAEDVASSSSIEQLNCGNDLRFGARYKVLLNCFRFHHPEEWPLYVIPLSGASIVSNTCSGIG